MGPGRQDSAEGGRDDARDPWPGPAGWFGKIPALGDFVSRRLPPEFIEPWDHWLSEELPAAERALGADWAESYANAPVWRFALMPQVLDSRHWLGVLMPSADRVGRRYPLTMAASFAPRIGTVTGWWSALIEVAVRARQPDCGAETLEAGLLAARHGQDAQPAKDPVQSRIAAALAAAGPGMSLWWPWQSHVLDGGTVSTLDGLPRGERFVALFRAPGRRLVMRD
jgi:type VI secretion system protein ImpM